MRLCHNSAKRLGGFDAESMEIQIFLISVGGAEIFGQLGRFVADGDELDSEHVVLAGFGGTEEIGDAETPAAVLSREGES